jgi:hypothetical protein
MKTVDLIPKITFLEVINIFTNSLDLYSKSIESGSPRRILMNYRRFGMNSKYGNAILRHYQTP